MVVSGGTYTADPTAVQQLLGGLGRLKVGSHISSNPERQHIFQVDSTGTRLAITERSGRSTNLIIGKMGPSFSEVYLRQAASKDVFLAEGIESSTLNKELKDWRDRTVLSLPSEAVNGLKYLVAGKQFDFHRDSTGWRSGDKAVETAVINPPLAALADLRADSFIDTALRVQTNPLSVSVEGAQNIALNFFPTLPDSAVYYVQASNSAQWFVVNKTTARQIFTPVSQTGGTVASVKEHETTATASEPPKKSVVVAPPPERKTAPSLAPASRNPLRRTTQPLPSPRENPRTESSRAPGSRTTSPGTGTARTASPRTTSPRTSPLMPPAQQNATKPTTGAGAADDEGELSVHTVAKGETMQSIALKYSVSVEQIMKWNLLKTIVVKPGQELYIFQKK
jgi:LysM repeat protein